MGVLLIGWLVCGSIVDWMVGLWEVLLIGWLVCGKYC